MNWLYTILLLICSNVFMTLAWFGHLKLKEMHISDSWPLIAVIVFSWGIAFIEYCFMIPSTRIGCEGTGAPYSLVQFKVIQEVISLFIFSVMTMFMFENQNIQWNHIVAFILLVLAVFFVFLK